MKLLLSKLSKGSAFALLSFFFSFTLFSQISHQGHIHNGIVRCATVQDDSVRHAQDPTLQTNEEFEAWINKLLVQDKKRRETALIIDEVYSFLS